MTKRTLIFAAKNEFHEIPHRALAGSGWRCRGSGNGQGTYFPSQEGFIGAVLEKGGLWAGGGRGLFSPHRVKLGPYAHRIFESDVRVLALSS